ncbi:MAG: DUF5069 domain-containing protein [Candidatus Methylacidiphilaceae bacterium]
MKLVPLISSGVAGPLGMLHLPRFWLKVVLAAKGYLAEGYPDCGKGFDKMTLDALGLDEAETLRYLRSECPSYTQFEAWILGKKGGKIEKATIIKHNCAVLGYIHDADTRRSILSAAGLPDDGSIPDAVNLNNLEDWTEFHKWLKSQ